MSKKDSTETVTLSSLADHEREAFHRQILSSVSHDLKTPLASIIGSLEIYERMGSRLSNEQREKLMTVALQEAYRLDNFITNILDMARLENGMVKTRRETMPLAMMVNDCFTRLGNRLQGSNISTKAPDDAIQVTTDPTLLSRAICLVLDNAVKYGGNPSTVSVAYGRNGGSDVFISVTDNGPGIPQEKLEEVFAKYTRFARGDQQNAGTGLGLSIAREIMRILGGTIKAGIAPEGGAVFTLKLPVAPAV